MLEQMLLWWQPIRCDTCVFDAGVTGLRGVVVMTAHGSLGWLYWITLIFHFCLCFSPVLITLWGLSCRFYLLLLRFWLGDMLWERKTSTSVALDTVISRLGHHLHKAAFSNKTSKSLWWVWCIFGAKWKGGGIASHQVYHREAMRLAPSAEHMRSFCCKVLYGFRYVDPRRSQLLLKRL